MCGHILYLSVSSTMPNGKRTLDKTQQPPLMGSRRQQTPGGGGKMTAVSPPLERVFLRHVYFMNNKSKYVSVGVFIPLATTSTVWNLARPGERRWYWRHTTCTPCHSISQNCAKTCVITKHTHTKNYCSGCTPEEGTELPKWHMINSISVLDWTN